MFVRGSKSNIEGLFVLDMKGRLFLCGMTGDRFLDIKEATKFYDQFDGLVFVDHLSSDGTKELLESSKGIIR